MPRWPAGEKKVKERPTPDLIRVRALHRGYYAVMEIIEVREIDGTKKRELGRNNLIRNEDEVFEYDTTDLPMWSKLTEAQRRDRESVVTERGEFALPRWVALAGKREKLTAEVGHTKTFGNAVKDEDDLEP
jgi:hypothetical protein